MSWDLTRREFIKGSIFLPSAVKAWMNEQIDGEQDDERKIYTAFMPFVAAGAKELSMLKIEWIWADLGIGVDEGIDILHDSETSPKMRGCDIEVTRLKGHGMPPVKAIPEPKGNDQVGITWLKDNLEPREMEMMVNLSGEWPKLWSARRLLVKKFSPRNSFAFDGYLRLTVPGGYERRLYVRYKSGLESDELTEDFAGMSFPLRVWAQDPLFYENDLSVEVSVMVASPDNITVENNGDWDVFPGIAIAANGGTVVNPLLENTTTGEAIQLTGYTALAGEETVYQFTYGDKDIFDDAGVSILNDLDPNNDLGSFHLQPGSNNIRVTIGGASTGVAETSIGWRNPYLSL